MYVFQTYILLVSYLNNIYLSKVKVKGKIKVAFCNSLALNSSVFLYELKARLQFP